MPTTEIKLVHVSPRVQARGGVEALHLRHREFAMAQHFVALFDRGPQAWPDYTNLNFTWRTPLWKMRREVRRALAPHAGAVVIYHHGWGLPLFHDMDAAGRRLVYCLGMPAYHEADLRASRGLVDGALGITPSLEPCWRATLPELEPERTTILPVPIELPSEGVVGRAPRAELVIGYAGRLERRHKRLDRLPAFLRELRATGCAFRFEVLGDGALGTELGRAVGDRVTFHGWTTKEEFWRVLARWDAMVFFSDMEGGPLALLEGCAVGVIPFFPAIGGSLGDRYAPLVDARCLYPSGDLRCLARNMAAVLAQTREEIAAARARAVTAVARHLSGDYEREMVALARAIVERPRRSIVRSRRPRLADVLPLGLVTRLMPWALRAG